ncbi:zinc transporter ZntB, partial [Brevirhabdus sp.]|uniref:zinc transporter ZntB n=1 Tax=Brevirhabdus sp. TaxID=2004514 RepID=UPI0040581B69
AEETRPRTTPIADGALMILRGVNLNEGAEPEDMVSIRLWVDAHRIISLQKRQLRAVLDIADRLEGGTGPQSSGEFISALITRLSDRIEPVLQSLDDETDELEETVVERPDAAQRRPVTEIRRRTIQLRRHIAPQREAVAALRGSDLAWLLPLDLRHLSEAQDSLTRTVETLDAIRDRAQVVKDELTSALSDRLNRNLYILAVVSAVFLPLGFLTGLMGVNLGGLPGAASASAFWLFCAILAGVAAAILLLLRFLRWL